MSSSVFDDEGLLVAAINFLRARWQVLRPVPGIRQEVMLTLRGEWITKEKAYAHGGEHMSVLHFTHDPIGFICTPEQCFS